MANQYQPIPCGAASAGANDTADRIARKASTRRIAIVAVHGVADQKLGDTAQALADLLIAQAPNGHSYQPGIRVDKTLQVPPMEPILKAAKPPPGLRKEFRQSAGSDFLRIDKNAAQPKGILAARTTALSVGAEFSDYLLLKAKQNNASTERYISPQVSLSRRIDGANEFVDIHEMHWADLSRLSGGAPRILTELFTLLFRLSALGRDTVQMQSAAPGFAHDHAWRTLQWTQTALDWLYSRVLALLFLQLGMVALLLVPFGLGSVHTATIHGVASALAGLALAVWLLYTYRSLVLALAAGGVLAYGSWTMPGAWMDGLAWIAILSLFYDWWMRVCDERFKMVRMVGWTLWPITAAATIGYAAGSPSADLSMWIGGALSALEIDLLLIVAWWGLAGPLAVVWMVASARASMKMAAKSPDATSRAVQAKSSVGTARMGLFVSLGFFAILTMTAWALVTTGVERSVDRVQYSPIIFKPLHEVAGDAPGPSRTTAAAFLDERFLNSTETFSAIALLLLPLIVYLVLMMLPSVLAELEIITEQFDRLGWWLTGGYRRLDACAAAIVGAGVVLAMVTGITLVLFRLGVESNIPGFNPLLEFFADASGDWLKIFVISAGTATVALSAAGGLLSRYVPWLRAPLDAALDVDNHFREFPRRAIPRARIFSRFFAVLNCIAAQSYDHIVIVSHSQGTVISTELLRYMKERTAHAQAEQAMDPVASLWERLGGRIALVTAGCPLRQLYAARFPVLYGWVLEQHGPNLGPVADDVGVVRWVNLYATGDYVGRWLWSRAPHGEYPVTQIDQTSALGDTYTPHQVDMTDWSALMGANTEKDISLGAGAHTHYFNIDQKTMAGVIDALLAS